MIYLDYNATTPVDHLVLETMAKYFCEDFGNPSNTYMLGNRARNAVQGAREHVSELIGASSNEIIFTGCGSESNNMVIKGVAYTFKGKGRHIVTSHIEHPSVLEPLRFLENNGFEVTYLLPNSSGIVESESVLAALRQDTILVTIMHSNNEVGALQPIRDIGHICRKNKVLFHTDASQSVGKVPVSVNDLQIDFMTIAGHKLYAPKGIGALYVRDTIQIEPLLHGASQENSTRAGTENVPYIVGLGKAAELAMENLKENTVFEKKVFFWNKLIEKFGNKIRLNGDFDNALPNTLSISFDGANGSELLARIPEIAASTGSACHSGQQRISPVLAAMGIEQSIAYGTIRFSLGRHTTFDELSRAVLLLSNCLQQEVEK